MNPSGTVNPTLYRILSERLSPLRSLIDDPDVIEIMCNGAGEVWSESRGTMERAGITLTDNEIEHVTRALSSAAMRETKEGTDSGIVDAEIPLEAISPVADKGTMRLAAVLSPTALRGHAMCLRKHSPRVMSMDDYLESGSFTRKAVAPARSIRVPPMSLDLIRDGGQALRDFLIWMVESKKTVLVSGSTGSGKTTFFKSLIQQIPTSERVITIEDTPELVVTTPNYVSLKANAQQGVTPQKLVRLSMRLRPDRILLGELRDATALDFLDAANTGHPGATATLHANDAVNALNRLLTLALLAQIEDAASIRNRILSTIDYVVHIGKDGRPGFVEQVIEVLHDAGESTRLTDHTRVLFSRYPQ